MGRGVEVRGDALIVAYADWTLSYEDWREREIELLTAEEWDYDEDDLSEQAFWNDPGVHQDHWDMEREWFIYRVQELWPSFTEVDRWADWPYRETHIVLENELVEVAIADYCGMTALTVAPKGGKYADYPVPLGLAARWAQQIEPKFMENFSNYYKIGAFSNGESVYGVKEASA